MKKIIKNRTEKNSGSRSGARRTLLRLMSVGLMLIGLSGCAKENDEHDQGL